MKSVLLPFLLVAAVALAFGWLVVAGLSQSYSGFDLDRVPVVEQ